jgi:hypothetical protein
MPDEVFMGTNNSANFDSEAGHCSTTFDPLLPVVDKFELFKVLPTGSIRSF